MSEITKKVVVVVVTYNRKELLHENIVALKKQDYDNIEVLVIDNASTDGTKEHIISELPENFHYINTGANLGGAGGFNFGMKKAMELKPDYILLMDDDTIVTEDTISNLVAHAKCLKDDFGFLSSYAKWTDGSYCKMNRQNIDKYGWIEDVNLVNNGFVRVDRATFVSFFVKREVVEAVGYPIKEFFIWADDTEYSNRIAKQYRCYADLNSVVIHKMKENADTTNQSFLDATDKARINRYFYSFRNHMYIARKKGKKESVVYFFKVLYRSFIVLRKANSSKFLKLVVLWKGFFAGLGFNPTIEY